VKFKRPTDGDTRVVKKFAIIPITIDEETIWLETVYILQVYVSIYARTFLNWNDTEFVSKEVYEASKEKENG